MDMTQLENIRNKLVKVDIAMNEMERVHDVLIAAFAILEQLIAEEAGK